MMLPVAGVVTILALVAGSVFVNAAFPLRRRPANWLALSLIMYGQIVLASTLLSELGAIALPGYLVFHTCILAGGILLWRQRGRPEIRSLYWVGAKEIRSVVRHSPLAVAFLVISLLALVVLSLPVSFTPGDAVHTYLPRVHYWIQKASARHFYTDNFRQVEFPPNSSFPHVWQVLATGGYYNLHLPQWFAGLLTAVAIGALSRLAGHGRGASMIASATYLCLPAIVLQMSTPLNDVLTAFGATTFVYFALAGIVRDHTGDGREFVYYLGYAGLAFGIFTGTKLTAFFLYPACAILAVLALVVNRRWLKRPVLYLGLSCGLGFLLFGSYNYILNTLDFGHPIASPKATGWVYDEMQSIRNPGALDEARSPIGNLVRYGYQVMDWHLVKEIPGADTLYLLNNRILSSTSEALGLQLESVSRFNLEDFGMRDVRPGEVGFGPIGYGLLLVAPLSLVLSGIHLRADRRHLISFVLIVLALGWVGAFASIIPYTTAKVRYFTIVYALLVPAIVPWIYRKRRAAWLWLVPSIAVSLWILFATAMASADYARVEKSLSDWQQEVLSNALPQEAEIAVSGPVEFIHILRDFHDYTFTPVPEAEILPNLVGGSYDAALVSGPEASFDKYQLPLEHFQSLLVEDPKADLLANLEAYGVYVDSDRDGERLRIEGGRLIRRTGPDEVLFFIPAAGPALVDQRIELRIEFPVTVPGDEDLTVHCGGRDIEHSASGSVLRATFNGPLVQPGWPHLPCELQISDYEFGSQIPSGSIEIYVQALEQS